jgi:guanylate kinase
MKNRKPAERGLLVVLSAASGTGKSTVAESLLRRSRGLVRSISVTTRPPRPDEADGRDYRFVYEAGFKKMAGRGDFLEWAKVHSHFYGTPAAFVEKAAASGKDVLLIIDVQGGRDIKARFPGAVLIFLAPPSAMELRRRLVSRGSECPGELSTRLSNAAAELACGTVYDYIVINDSVARAAEKIRSIITAEKCSAGRMSGKLMGVHKETDCFAKDFPQPVRKDGPR